MNQNWRCMSFRTIVYLVHKINHAKKERYDIKQQRLYLAQDEYNLLNKTLSTLNTSRSSSLVAFRFRRVEQKLSGGCYNINEAQAMVAELREIQRSLTSGEQERIELMRSLAKLKDDLTRLQFGESSPDVSTLSLPNTLPTTPVLPSEKFSTASQTDLSGELVPIGTRLAAMARMRLEYDESRKRIQYIQQQLADLEEKVTPGQAESDKDRYEAA
ncbi:unnamed protein product [Nesidiocoris tenuis]|uniref:WWC1-like helical hairpin domain-containing protein n=1 Tax=Nesidiocoris tenuis TaxID=355587 RepID=A0A6H5H919_9HEMI|nr:unnamed protein product [Nesidiocoris tenuis]